MAQYVSLFRGINVGGNKIIKMAELKSLFENLDFEMVKTYIQSGNVVFETALRDVFFITKMLEQAVLQKFGFEVQIHTFEADYLKNILDKNPFNIRPEIQGEHVYISFLKEQPGAAAWENPRLQLASTDRYEYAHGVIYVYAPNGYSKTPYHNLFFEKNLKVTSTTRNLKSCQAILALCT
jgi:uncharacterized protein (DUF1697 family)